MQPRLPKLLFLSCPGSECWNYSHRPPGPAHGPSFGNCSSHSSLTTVSHPTSQIRKHPLLPAPSQTELPRTKETRLSREVIGTHWAPTSGQIFTTGIIWAVLPHFFIYIRTTALWWLFISPLILPVPGHFLLANDLPGLDYIQTAGNYSGSRVRGAIVGCFSFINRNKCIAVSCFLQDHCFHKQEEAHYRGPKANFTCILGGQIMPRRLQERTAIPEQARSAGL